VKFSFPLGYNLVVLPVSCFSFRPPYVAVLNTIGVTTAAVRTYNHTLEFVRCWYIRLFRAIIRMRLQ